MALTQHSDQRSRYEAVMTSRGRPLRNDRLVPPTNELLVCPPGRRATSTTSSLPARNSSGSEVVRAGSRALQERDAAVEKWLRDEVVEVCDAMRAEPRRAILAEKVFAAIRARHADRLKKQQREPRGIEFSPEALGDLIDLYDCIASRDGAERVIGHQPYRGLLPQSRGVSGSRQPARRSAGRRKIREAGTPANRSHLPLRCASSALCRQQVVPATRCALARPPMVFFGCLHNRLHMASGVIEPTAKSISSGITPSSLSTGSRPGLGRDTAALPAGARVQRHGRLRLPRLRDSSFHSVTNLGYAVPPFFKRLRRALGRGGI